MKKLIFSLWALACTMSMSAQQLSIIQGKFNSDDNIPKMSVYKVENSNCIELGSSTVDKSGRFALACNPEKEGFYVVARNDKAHMQRYIFYLKPGDNINFSINGDNWQLEGTNTPENQELEKWHKAIYPIEAKAVYFSHKRSNYKDFFPEFTSMLPTLEKYPKAKTKNKVFNAAFEDFKHYNLCDDALMFVYTPRSAQPKAADYIDFYRQMSVAELSKKQSLLDYPGGVDMLANVKMTNYRADKSIPEEKLRDAYKSFRAETLKEITDPTIKGEFVLNGTLGIKTYPGLVDYNNKYGQYLVNDSQKLRMKQIIAKYDKNEAGNEAAVFKLPDTTGKMHSLTDFRGKLVYIDFWATWCGPCKGEIPYMTKLEEEYANNPDIVFISVSVDKEADKQKWLDMVKEKNMKGLQLFTGDLKDQVSEPYHIVTIPRFILIGRDGKLIDGNAPRPSSDEIRPLINFNLKKK